MAKKGKWFGLDASNRESLFEYGFIMRRYDNFYEVVVNCGDKFRTGEFYAEDVLDELELNYADNKRVFPCYEDISENDYGFSAEEIRKQFLSESADWRACDLLSAMLGTYDYESVIGWNYSPFYTKAEIKKKLGRALSY